jgi:hypothetical protein
MWARNAVWGAHRNKILNMRQVGRILVCQAIHAEIEKNKCTFSSKLTIPSQAFIDNTTK